MLDVITCIALILMGLCGAVETFRSARHARRSFLAPPSESYIMMVFSLLFVALVVFAVAILFEVVGAV